jgi:hypothetical protein
MNSRMSVVNELVPDEHDNLNESAIDEIITVLVDWV